LAGFGFMTSDNHPEPFTCELWAARRAGFEFWNGRVFLALLTESQGGQEDRIKVIKERGSHVRP
jgi:hypothetical protein